MCKAHYTRFRLYGDPNIRKTAPANSTPWEKILFTGWDEVEGPLETPCWEWRGRASDTEYGRVMYKGKGLVVTRVVMERETRSKIPRGLVVRHKCDNPPCINPEHLELGTVSQNAIDMVERGRANPPVGEKNGMRILTEREAKDLRDRWDSGESGSKLAREFGVSPSTVSMIGRRLRWKHL